MVDSEGFNKRVVYCIFEYDPLIDSSNMSYYEYRQLAQDIQHRVRNSIYNRPMDLFYFRFIFYLLSSLD